MGAPYGKLPIFPYHSHEGLFMGNVRGVYYGNGGQVTLFSEVSGIFS